MKKNVGSQIIGCQLVSKTDGSAVTTGTTTVYVTGDGGTQAAGSVGSGACTHEGQGFWTYAPAQAETNYDHVAFTFVNSSAVSVTVQLYPSFPQTGDSFARLGAPAGASVSADVAAIKAETASIQTDTNDIQTRIPAALVGGRMDSSVGAMSAAAVQAIWDALTSALTTVGSIGKLLVDNINATISSRLAAASYTAPLDAAGTRAAVGLAAADLDAQLDALPTAAENADAVWDEARAGHVAAGSFGEGVASVQGSVTGSVASVTGAVGSVTGLTASDVGAIKTKTDSLTFTVAGQVDANIQYVNDTAIQGTGAVGTDEWRKV